MKKILLLLLLLLFVSTTAFANGKNVQTIAITTLDETPVYNKPIADPSNLAFKATYGAWFQNYQSSGGWIIHTLQDGRTLYISSKHVAIYVPHVDYLRDHQVNTKEAYVFATPSITSKVRAIIPKGAFVFSYGLNGNFYYVSFIHNNQPNSGFISKNAVKNIPSLPQQKPPQPNLSAHELLVFSNDGHTFLGKLDSNKYDADSVCNKYGDYGRKYSATSIWNEYGTYGSKYSTESAFNQYTNTPPVIISNGKFIGYLTVNHLMNNAISPYGICK